MSNASQSQLARIAASSALALVIALAACSRAGGWPPPEVCDSGADGNSGKHEAKFGNNARGHSVGFVCGQSDMKCTGREALAWGPLLVEGEIMLPGDVFAIERPSEGYSENSYEVIRHNEKGTLIRLVRSRGDEMLLAKTKTLGESTATTSGSKVRCGANVYDLRPDGWYLKDKKVHDFLGATKK